MGNKWMQPYFLVLRVQTFCTWLPAKDSLKLSNFSSKKGPAVNAADIDGRTPLMGTTWQAATHPMLMILRPF
ncbi:Aspercryptin biosynthesis cluster-specific transcription regulator atnN [Fusarium oxysporum f. sp. albedinis]|nr:Aspercryptin biosynthesis cluster-specific transcription regulator atnN [Fusarium oxysporum f. sp. albedinis]